MAPAIPKYALYGDAAAPPWLDIVHIEQIHERSSLFNFRIDPHVHEGLIQVLHVMRGGGEVLIDGARWVANAPALIVIPTSHVHGFRFRHDVDGPVVTAAQRPLESLAAVAAPALLAHIRRPRVMDISGAPRHAEALPPLFEAIEREARLQNNGEAAAGTALLFAIFVQIARIAAAIGADDEVQDGGRSRKAAQVEDFRALVDRKFRERWSLERYAEHMGLTAGHLSRLCRDVLGLSALEVINARIVREAERELIYSTLAIKQIAAFLGFADEAYFGRFFRKHTGRTPTEFRAIVRARLALTTSH